MALGALRSIGLPARYVSGYLHPARHAAPNTTVTGESPLLGRVVVRQLGRVRPDPATRLTDSTSGSGTVATTATWPRCAAPTPAARRRCS